MKKELDNKPKRKYNVNRNGFHTKNNTQNMSKDKFSKKLNGATEGNWESINKPTEGIPSGENGLPDLH